jgi:4-diphosphocytidyl-2-C-methyl-D-erythritol kinase
MASHQEMRVNPRSLRVFAAAKVNLFLHVGERRSDGYHDLESLVAFADVGDELSFTDAVESRLEIRGPFADGLAGDENNLVSRAAAAMSKRFGAACGAHITLEKNLPVSSGIGGGSADAAATLRGLSQLWGANADTIALRELAESLGSDVPVCLASVPSWMEGRGERVTEIPNLPGLSMVLVNPGVAISTSEIFAALKQRRGVGIRRPARFATGDALLEFLQATTNDLEPPAAAAAPMIKEALEALRSTVGVGLARMSGSGATSFALYKDAAHASAAASALNRAKSKWWVRKASFYSLNANQ